MERVEWSTALARFTEDYQDILKDQNVANVAGSIGRTLLQQAMQDSQANSTPRRPYWDILNEAGGKTRDWLKGLAGQQAEDPEKPKKPTSAQPAVNLSAERETRKRAAPQPPTPRSAQPSVPTAQTKPDSDEKKRRSAIQEMQKSRGQIA
ncbi:MAG: hypothetical protein IIB61_01500 [Planctomycetes bacterium]|nr:hypothetical protein [Planctomycetota bacterium]